MDTEKIRGTNDILEDILQQLKFNNSQPIYPSYQQSTEPPFGYIKCNRCGGNYPQPTHFTL